MEYRGLGSGIRRALKYQPNIQLVDDKESNKFMVTIPRQTPYAGANDKVRFEPLILIIKVICSIFMPTMLY